MEGQTVEGWFDLMNGEEPQGRINLSVSYTPKEELAEEESLVVPNSYFPARENSRVVLYQDAHTPQLPVFDNLTAVDGSPYQATTAWKDLFKLLKEATKFIYITGWSVYTEIALVRDEDDPDGESNVGELLKRKADEGVKVLIMVWNEKLSTSKSAGLMGTHDEETRQYFEGTAVNCKTIGRCKQQDSRLASEFASTCYTHHQKTIIADAPLEEGDEDPDAPRRVVAFIGGLDITDGRYDTPEFHLWKTINNTHKGDFYSKCVKGITPESGPRQPWHDCHAKVEGQIAVDIMQNFNERWRKQADDDVGTLVHLNEDEYQLDAEPPVPEYEGGLWTTQLFRSITSDSCIFDFERQSSLHSKYGRLVENSIMRTTVLRIRNCKNFIYLENQYFLGSAYAWYGDSGTLTMHIVPREITQKIVEKIAAGEDFKVYAVIPMFPEGIPTDAAIQEILYWQWRTFETMYKRIAKAIADNGVDAHPTDYLNFYCLGKREAAEEMPEGEFETPAEVF